MRRIIASIGATLVVAAAIGTSAAPASAGCGEGGWYVCERPAHGGNFGMADGSVRFIRD